MEHVNADLLAIEIAKSRKRSRKKEHPSSEADQLSKAIEMISRVNWKLEGNEPLAPSAKKFKRELNRKFKNETLVHFRCL